MKSKTIMAMGLAALTPLAAFTQTNVLLEEDSFFDTYVKGRLHMGLSFTRLSMDRLSTPHERAFLGNLDTLKEEDTEQVGFTVKYDFCKYFSVMYADDMHAELSAWNNNSESPDGSLKLDGYTVLAIGQLPFEAVEGKLSLTPYIGLGYSDISANWSYANWWHWGWSSPQSYANIGNGSREPHKGYSRWMIPEDPSSAFTYSIGLVVTAFAHLDLDIFYRAVDLDDVKTNFRTGSASGRILREGSFPAKFSAFGVALKYVF